MNPQLSFFINKSIQYIRDGNYQSAELLLKQSLKLARNHPEVLRLLGVIEAKKGNHENALQYFSELTKITPKNGLIFSNKGNVLFELKRYAEALASHEKAIALAPHYAEAYSNKGNVLFALKRYAEALASHEKAISLAPNYAEAYSNKGNALLQLKRYGEALAYYDQAIGLMPDYAEAYSNRSNVLLELKRYDEALASNEKALLLAPDYAEAYSNQGNVLFELKHYAEALTYYDQAIGLMPNYVQAWSNKGNTLQELKRYEEAIIHYAQALSLQPDIDWVYGYCMHLKMKACSWDHLPEQMEQLLSKVQSQERVSVPFALLSLSADPSLNKTCSEIYARAKYPFNPILGPIPKHLKKGRIRIGYYSADFYDHATGYLIAELFELQDKSRFELIGFSFGPQRDDEMRHRLLRSFDQFIEVGDQSDLEIAQLSRHLKIDIAVDLKGFTRDCRSGIFSYRAAPIQVNYLGYPGTMGSDFMDYIIADPILIPSQLQQFYSEKVVYLPYSYQVNDRKRVIADQQCTRGDLGLPEEGFVFCCFNSSYKILPATFDIWMRILLAVEGSVLWLLEDNLCTKENLIKEAVKRGVTESRLVFAKRLPLAEHLARHQQADLFIDTLPCNAHTTTSDALWAGLPVLTIMGESFASRVAASLLNSMGLPELIASSQADYESSAIELAKNPRKLAVIKDKLANQRLTAPLFDTPLFTKHLESAYTKMYEIYQADLPVEHITVEASG
jgi:predicted O-linked N-acetylglucosamine transferase (SPINDLY family)